MSDTKVSSIFNRRYCLQTLVAAIVAAMAAYLSKQLGVEPWVMFIGWVAYFTRPGSCPGILACGLCLCFGILLGMIAAQTLNLLIPKMGSIALAIVVLIVALLVVTLRALPIVGNIAAWFLGLITFFAADMPANFIAVIPLILTTLFGIMAGLLVLQLQIKIGKQ